MCITVEVKCSQIFRNIHWYYYDTTDIYLRLFQRCFSRNIFQIVIHYASYCKPNYIKLCGINHGGLSGTRNKTYYQDISIVVCVSCCVSLLFFLYLSKTFKT